MPLPPPPPPARTPAARTAAALAAGLLAALLAAGCAPPQEGNLVGRFDSPGTNTEVGSVEVRQVRLAEPPDGRAWSRGDDIPLYGRFYNESGAPDRLVGAESPVAGSVEIVGREGGTGLEVPPEGVLVLGRDRPHLVLRGVEEPVRGGDFVPVTLRFERSGVLETRIETQPPTHDDPPGPPLPSPEATRASWEG